MNHEILTRHRSACRRGLALCVLAVVAGSGMMACADDHTAPISLAVGILYGHVVAEGDPRVPVEGVIIRGRYYPTRFGGCHDGAPTTLPYTTGASGHYRVAIGSPAPMTMCARVEASPPAGSGLLPATSEEVEVTLGGAGMPVDSVRVDIVLHPDPDG